MNQAPISSKFQLFIPFHFLYAYFSPIICFSPTWIIPKSPYNAYLSLIPHICTKKKHLKFTHIFHKKKTSQNSSSPPAASHQASSSLSVCHWPRRPPSQAVPHPPGAVETAPGGPGTRDPGRDGTRGVLGGNDGKMGGGRTMNYSSLVKVQWECVCVDIDWDRWRDTRITKNHQDGNEEVYLGQLYIHIHKYMIEYNI